MPYDREQERSAGQAPNQPGQIPQEHGAQEHGELPKVTVRGRIGQVYEPTFVGEQGDRLVFKFSVAEHPTADQTTWYRVVTFGDRARAMQQRFEADELRVGQEVVVVGRLREQQYVSRRTGEPGTDREIFPFAVTPAPASSGEQR